jgi:amidohydrolase
VLEDEMVENRRWFHARPELSFQEFITSAKVAELLRSYGITEIYENVGKTGVVGVIRGGAGEGPCVALRADMDGLPLTETADIPYKSTHEGVMHACGHDGHMTSLLATAKVLHQTRESFKGVVKLVFQPAEEGLGGAPEMIKDGVLEDGPCGPRVDSIYGIHIWSACHVGGVECSEGPVMAASDRFDISVRGKGGHGAMPAGTVDAIVEAAAVVTSLQTIVSRNKDPTQTGVVTCGQISGGYGYNIIADHVKITGTCRSFTAETQELIRTRMCQICCGVAQTYGGEIDVDYKCRHSSHL